MTRALTRTLGGGLLFLAFPSLVWGQDRYRDPPAAIARVLDAVPSPAVLLSPDRSKLLLMEQPGLPSIALVAGELRLAGARINPRNNAPSRQRTYGTMVVQPIPRGDPRRIVVPWHARVGGALWAPDGNKVAFTILEDAGVSLWLADASSGAIRMVSGPTLNAAFGAPCRWMPSSDALLCNRLPASRRALPAVPAAPAGPLIRETGGHSVGTTSQEPHRETWDEAQFERYFSDQLVLIPLAGNDRPVGGVGLHADVRVSPDGQYLLVHTLHGPYSSQLPWQRFPRRVEIWDLSGSVLKVISDGGLQESRPSGADATSPGPREVSWRSDAPAALSWVEALDGGNPEVPAKVRDRLMMLSAPFSTEPVRLGELALRVTSVTWGPRRALVTEQWRRTRRTRTWLLDVRQSGADARLLFDRSSDDSSTDPGSFVTRTVSGAPLLVTSKDGQFGFLTGGERPFLDRIDFATGKVQRLWRAEAPYYEEVAALLDPDAGRLLTVRESASEPPNWYLRELKRSPQANLIRLTSFADPAPELAGISRQRIVYQRGDGVQLPATLYLPPGYDKSRGPLPFLIWDDFQEGASTSAGWPYRFVRPVGVSPLFLLLAGYGVLETPGVPDAEAAVAKLVSLGVADPKRIAIGGYSDGASVALNLLTLSKRFRAGIALSGAYAPRYPENLNGPLLLIHGMADDSSGSSPQHSEGLYQALEGKGAKVRLVLLPGEEHEYRARESVGQVLYEMVAWLERWMK